MPRRRRRQPAAIVDPRDYDWLSRRLPRGSGILRAGGARWIRSLAWMTALSIALVTILSLQSAVRSVAPDPTLLLDVAFLTVVLAYAAYALLVRRFERRRLRELAIRHLPAELFRGLLLGMGLMSLVILILAASGAYSLAWASWTDWPHDVRESLGTGLLEELLARLVIFRLLACAMGARPALVVSAALFGGAHLANPHGSIIAAAAIAVEAGLMLAGFYLLTGRIWMSVGAHAGWNLAQGGVFGTPVSGMPSDGSLLKSLPSTGAMDWWTGGTFGPEGSMVAVVVGAATFAATLVILRRGDPPCACSTPVAAREIALV
jgi:membrane protease YdiL (CAAX protease family)